jgi:Phage integrase family
VRASAKRMSIPDILTAGEMQQLIAAVELRERVLMFLDIGTGLRRGELAGLKWADIDFLNLQINVTRSVVDQHVGKCKTEISQKPVPMDEYTASDLMAWYQQTPFRAPGDWVFATNSNRAGHKRGKQPLWAVQDHEPSYSTDRQKVGDHKAHWLAHVPAHLLKHAEGEWRGCESGAGTVAACFHENNTGHLRASTDAGEAGGTAQGGRDDPGRISVYRECTAGKWGAGVSSLFYWRPRRDLNPCYRRERTANTRL